MRHGRGASWLFGMILVAGMANVPAAAQATIQSAAQKIPTLHGMNFSGDPVDLPEVLHGKVGILVIGFSQGSRDAVTVWGTKLAADYLNSSTVLFYEIPVLASVPKPLRGFVTGRIKAAVADKGRPHFIPLTDNEAAWRTLVHYQAPDDSYLLLVDGQGIVHWQTQGPATDARYAALKQQVKALQTRPLPF